MREDWRCGAANTAAKITAIGIEGAGDSGDHTSSSEDTASAAAAAAAAAPAGKGLDLSTMGVAVGAVETPPLCR